MIFYIIFILVWIAIITLAKNKIKNKIKKFFYSNYNSNSSDIYKNIEHELIDINNTLHLNILSIKDELNRKKIKLKTNKKTKIKKDIVEYKENINNDDEDDDDLDFYEIFQKTISILHKLIYSIYKKIKKSIFH